MEARDTLWHIDWGDGDTTFVVAPDRETAISRMPDGKDMVNTVVQLDCLYNLILEAGIRKAVEGVKMQAIDVKRNAQGVYELHRQLKPKDNQAKVRHEGYDNAMQDLIDYLQAQPGERCADEART